MDIYLVTSEFVPSEEDKALIPLSKAELVEVLEKSSNREHSAWWGIRRILSNQLGYVPAKNLKFKHRTPPDKLPNNFLEQQEKQRAELEAMYQSKDTHNLPDPDDDPPPDYSDDEEECSLTNGSIDDIKENMNVNLPYKGAHNENDDLLRMNSQDGGVLTQNEWLSLYKSADYPDPVPAPRDPEPDYDQGKIYHDRHQQRYNHDQRDKLKEDHHDHHVNGGEKHHEELPLPSPPPAPVEFKPEDSEYQALSEFDQLQAPSFPSIKHPDHNAIPVIQPYPDHIPVDFDDSTLIKPKKLENPNLKSKEKQALHKELLMNQKMGVNVLQMKSELKRALEKRQDSQRKREIEEYQKSKKTDLELRLEERALKLKMQEEANLEKSNEPAKENEFQRVRTKIYRAQPSS